MYFKRTIRLRDGTTIIIRPLLIKDIIFLHKMYLSLSNDSKLFFHPYILQPKLGWLWIREEILTILSCFSIFRKIFLRIFQKGVYFCLIALNSKQEIVGFTRLIVTKQLPDGGYAAINGTIVRDDYQNKGLGYHLSVCRIDLARINEIREISLLVLAQNARIIHVLQKQGFKMIKKVKKRDIWKGKVYKTYEMILHLR